MKRLQIALLGAGTVASAHTVTSGSDEVIEQITKQLNKLIDVIKVVDLSEAAHIERELMLIKVRATGKDRPYSPIRRFGQDSLGEPVSAARLAQDRRSSAALCLHLLPARRMIPDGGRAKTTHEATVASPLEWLMS